MQPVLKRSDRTSPGERAGERLYSRYFVVPKRDGGLRPILDLRPINRALCKHPFRMILLVQVLAQIRHWGLVASVDLKDAYFHIQIAPHHRRFLRFALEGTALPVPCSSVWAGFGPTHFLKVHGRSSLPPPQSEWDARSQLFG